MMLGKKESEVVLLLNKFNSRDSYAFGEIYCLLYKEFYYFTNTLYKDTTIEADDVIHDIFIYLWENKKIRYNSIKKL